MKWIYSASAGALFVILVAGYGPDGTAKAQTNEQNAQSEPYGESNGSSETVEMKQRTSIPFQIIPPTGHTLPLLAMMINLEQNLAALQAGIWRGEYETISKAANGLVSHGKLDDQEIQKIRTILGDDGLKNFAAADAFWHDKAKELAREANEKDLEKITNLTAEMIQRCSSCHIKYRTPLRDSPKWLEW